MLRPFYRQGKPAACGGRQPHQQPRIPVLAEDMGCPGAGGACPGFLSGVGSPSMRLTSLIAKALRLCTRGQAHACGAVGRGKHIDSVDHRRRLFTPAGRSSRPGENGCEIPPVGAFRAVHIADPDVNVVWAEKVGPVGGAVHPPIESLLGRAGGRVARGVDILPDPGPVVPLPPHPITRARSVRASVREKIIAGHVGAVEPRRRLELALKIVGLEPLGLALGVDQAQ